MNKILRHGAVLALAFVPVAALAAEVANRKIEEIVITSERVESTVSDTSISITAFDGEMLEDFGIQSADELIDYIPATTRDPYDIRIRGVGRNFRALGGDPGVATYYNGVYSPDFGIAASENALYDLERVEVLRGPQGTLYGRNSIGGALNYVTRQPTFEWTGEVRAQVGALDGREYFGYISGPLIEDKLAFRLVGNNLHRQGSESNVGPGRDPNSIRDENYSLHLTWNITDTISLTTRTNDRLSNRIIGTSVIVEEGVGPARGRADPNLYVSGVRPVAANTPGALRFVDPLDGTVRFGAFLRPGVDPSNWPYSPMASFHNPEAAGVSSLSRSDIGRKVSINAGNGGDGKCEWPYTDSTCQDEKFAHNANQTTIAWDVSETLQVKYFFGYNDFTYHFNLDADGYDAAFTQYRATVDESVESKSHELQVNWALGEKFTATSGIYRFSEDRDQDYSVANSIDYYVKPVDYGALKNPNPFFGGASYIQLYNLGGHKRLGSAAPGTSNAGLWEGDPRGDIYHHMNKVHNSATAYFTQGTYAFNDQWALVLGVRYAEDRKSAKEVRGGYFELAPFAPAALAYGQLGTPVLSPSALTNIALGAARYSGNPNDPLIPTCALGSESCAKPLRLGAGMPISYSSNLKAHDSWSDTNYRININWTPTDDTLVYASYTTGYRAGGYSLGIADARDNLRDPVTNAPLPGATLRPLSYDQEEVKAYEIGYKGTFQDGAMQLNSSVYLYSYKNYQDELEQVDAIRGTVVAVVGNAPKASNMGFETDILWLPTDALTVGANYSYTKTEYDASYLLSFDNDPNLPKPIYDDRATTKSAQFDRPDLYIFDLKGESLKRIPEHKAVIFGNYLVGTSFGSFTFSGVYAYTGKQYDAGREIKLYEVPDRFQMNLGVTFNDQAGKYTIRAFVDNVTNELSPRGVSQADDSSNNNWRTTASHLYPRFWGVDATYRFGL